VFWGFEMHKFIAEVEGLSFEEGVLLFGRDEFSELSLIHQFVKPITIK